MALLSELDLNDRMKLQTIRRTHSGAPMQICTVLFMIWLFHRYFSEQGPLVYPSFIAIAVLLIGRWLFVQAFLRDRDRLLKSYHYQLGVAVVTAFFYGMVVADSIFYFTDWSNQTALVFYFSLGVISVVVQSLAMSPNYQRLYVAFISLPILIAFFYRREDETFVMMGILYSIYVAYLVFNSIQITKDAIHSYKLETMTRAQKVTLQKVINLVPGFVALADSAGNWVNFSESFLKIKDTDFFKTIAQDFNLKQNFNLQTNEYQWNENGQEHAYIISLQRYKNDLSTVVVGIPAENLVNMRKELDFQRSKAEFSARLATLGEMAGGIAHEINNPLAVIIGNCEQMLRLMQQDVLDSTRLKERLEIVAKTSFRISKIINGLRAFARQADSDPVVYCSLEQVVEDTLELCREKFHQNQLSLVVDDVPKIQVPMRSVQISQVLINLLNNSFDAVKSVGEKRINIHFRQTEDFIYISVSDTGPGIPQAIRGRIFNPFFTNKSLGQGTGLGLSISRGIVLDHKGEIYLVEDSSLTTFEIKLPLKISEY